MPVTAVTYYSVSMSLNGSVVWTRGPQRGSGVFGADGVQSYSSGGSSPSYAKLYFINVSPYPYRLFLSVGTVRFGQSGPSTISAGTVFGNVSTVFSGSSIIGYQVNGAYGAATGGSYVAYEGNRTFTLKCTDGGVITTPSVAGGISTVPTGWTRPTGDRSAATNFATLVAGDALPSTGTLLARGFTAGTWVNWTWPVDLFTSAQQTSPGASTAKTITLSLLEGSGDGTVTANFTRAENSASVWSPLAKNMVVHLLDSSLVETESSINAVGTTAEWQAFRAKGFTALSCGPTGASRDWYPTTAGYTNGVYLMNVSAATFAVTPISGMRVYAWKVESADGTFVSFGSADSVSLSGFEEGCKVHLYLTSATPNPKIVYDGFDETGGGTAPATSNVLVGGASFTVGSSWTATGAATAVAVSMSPAAWQARVLGQARFVLVDGVSTPLANVAGTGASITSAATPYAVNHVKFKQTVLVTDGELTVTVVIDTISAVLGVLINVTQLSTLLKTLTDSGTANYYMGADLVTVTAAVDFGNESPANFTLRMVPDAVYDNDVIGTNTASLQVTGATRAITFYATQVVVLGSLTAVDINLTRDVSVGSQIATSAGPVTQCYAGGISVSLQTPTGQSTALPLYIECSAASGYTLKSIRVIDSATGLKTYYAGVAPSSSTPIYLNVPRADTGADIKVILVLSAVIVGIPSILPALPDDLGKFSAQITSVGAYADFRVGDSVRLDVEPATIGGSALPDVVMGNPLFNDVEITPVRTGAAVAITVSLKATGNVFKVPVYATFAASASGASPSLTTTWDVEDTLTVSAVVYRRLGSAFTVTGPLTSAGTTVVSGRVSRLIAAGTYVESAVLLPYVASLTTRSFTSTLRAPTTLALLYTAGVSNPAFSFAAYDYGTGTYITQGVRPTVKTTAVAPTTLSDNIVTGYVWPVTKPAGYDTAAILVRTATGLLPQIDIRITSAVPALLEVWNASTQVWAPYTSTIATLAAAFTFFRVSVGDAPDSLVDVEFETAVDSEGTDVPGCAVYATSGVVYDGNFAIPATMQARGRSVLHVRVTPPYGYVVTGWYVYDVHSETYVLTGSGASLSIIVPDTGLLLKPQLAARQFAALSVMVMNADPNKTDEGMWVSKLFRAQYPWKPLTAHVVARPSQTPVTLAVMKDGGPAPTAIDPDNPGTVAVTVVGETMRRLPPGQIQKSRFVRYMLAVSGEASVSSVAIGSGAETMKGGH